jgi:hypothetical protein
MGNRGTATARHYAIWHDGYGVGLSRNSPIRPDRIIRRLSELLPEANFWLSAAPRHRPWCVRPGEPQRL